MATGAAFHGQYHWAVLMIVLGAVFDFFDGMSARALGVSSPIGKELDSLADVVTFGVAPSAIIFYLFHEVVYPEVLQPFKSYIPYSAFLLAAFSALRLAKFNIDDTQTTEFCGLPTPANGLFCLSLAMLMAAGSISLSQWAILTISIGMAYMLISPIRMFALKFKGFGWQGNELRYLFILASALIIAFVPLYSVAIIITLYIVVSTVKWLFSKKGEC